MSIFIIQGPPKSGKSTIANALRNSQITAGCGALLIDEDQDGDARPLIEKLISGAMVPDEPPTDLKTIPWKKNPMVIVIGKKEATLKELDAVLPGFINFMGPIRRITTS